MHSSTRPRQPRTRAIGRRWSTRRAPFRGGRGREVELPPPPASIPPVPEGLSPYALAIWDGFFTQPVAGLVDMRRDGDALRWWIRCVDQRDHLLTLLAETPTVAGSMGQTVEHPLWKIVTKLSAEIARAEVNFGMTPLLKMRLTGHVDRAQEAESNIRARREGRRPARVTVVR